MNNPRYGVWWLAFAALLLVVMLFAIAKHRLDVWLVRRGRAARVERDAREIYRAASEYRSQKGDWPRTLVDIINADTRDRDAGGCESYPRDPWNSEYSLGVEHGELVITSFGRDRRPGGAGEDADMVSAGGRRVSSAAGREP
jgi:hypothetical protein